MSWLEKALDFQFANVELFKQALTHRSAAKRNNERLEFLGDAVLDFVISDIIFLAHPESGEGDLSRLRASLVCDATLAELAMELGLGEHLILGSGELKTGGHRRESILADALEAIFGAVFLDAGFPAATAVIHRAYADRIENLPDVADLKDPKTRLQEWLQARKMELPVYELVRTSGDDHKRIFEVSCTIAHRSMTTRGQSTSRRKAEQEAARKLYPMISSEQR